MPINRLVCSDCICPLELDEVGAAPWVRGLKKVTSPNTAPCSRNSNWSASCAGALKAAPIAKQKTRQCQNDLIQRIVLIVWMVMGQKDSEGFVVNGISC